VELTNLQNEVVMSGRNSSTKTFNSKAISLIYTNDLFVNTWHWCLSKVGLERPSGRNTNYTLFCFKIGRDQYISERLLVEIPAQIKSRFLNCQNTKSN
jgi:hypothetical protein